MHNRFNVSVAELDANEKWQRALLGVVTLSDDRQRVDQSLSAVAEWVQSNPLVTVTRIEQEMF